MLVVVVFSPVFVPLALPTEFCIVCFSPVSGSPVESYSCGFIRCGMVVVVVGALVWIGLFCGLSRWVVVFTFVFPRRRSSLRWSRIALGSCLPVWM